VHHEKIKGRASNYGPLEKPLPDVLVAALKKAGIENLYTHQVAAVDCVREGKNVIVSTPTASGKSLIYNLPVFEKLIARPDSKALYLFPLKALAQDQLRAVKDLAHGLPENLRPAASIYDGDTNAYQRKKMRDTPPQVLISNPDMLHLSLLGYHQSWGLFFSGLSHVILDEVHTYRGVFGSHMAWVLRRLRRICRLYNSNPCFILSSATVGNPAEMAEDLLGLSVEVIQKTGAPQGRRHFLFLNPLDSPAYSACQLLEAALKRGLRTIVYTQSRKMAELIYVWTKKRLGPFADKLSPYRAGYRADERREIEKKLANGELLGVISTSALELGIDIGTLDICVLVGYPGTIMTTWQRGGRVGRGRQESLIILVAQEDALDQHFMRNPDDFFSRQVESTVLNPHNRIIMKRHLVCAAAEQPISLQDPIIGGKSTQSVINELAEKGALLLSADGSQWFGARKYPHREIDLRGSGKTFLIRIDAGGTVLGEIDGLRCLKECHPGAIYLHRGQTWLVTDLDLEDHEVRVVRKNASYFTRALGNKKTEILKTYKTMRLFGFQVSLGYLRVTETITGFQRRLVGSQKLLSSHPLDLPPSIFETEGLWIEVPSEIQGRIEKKQLHFMGGIHAVEHLLIGLFPLLVLCDRNDVGGISCPFHEQLPGAGIFIYDGYPGGVGLSRKAFEKILELLQLALKTISSCSCEIGCPSCVHSPKCGSGNRPMDKAAALDLIDMLLSPRNEKHSGGQPQTKQKRFVVSASTTIKKEEVGIACLPERYGVFDIETQRSASEVGGWHRADRMGMSVAVVYDSRLDQYCTYLEKDIPDLLNHLQQLDLVIGFNNKRFDNRVLSAYTSLDLGLLPTLDILEEITSLLGYRLSLDRLAEHTLGVKKTANGLQALKWYREGRMDDLILYCRKDVEITRDIFLFGTENRYLLFNNKAGKIVRLPVSFL